jgi:transmembrane sensor
MMPGEDEVRSVIAEQAGEWFVANQAGALSADESAAFLAWLQSSPIHVKEYLEIARIARGWLDAVRDPQVPLESFLAHTRAPEDTLVALECRERRRERTAWRQPISSRGPLLATAAALLLLAAGILWWAHNGEVLGIPKTYRTAHGEQATQQLPDGSILRLDTDSEATVRYSASERLVELQRGQALFEVAHETGRRFRVRAGDAGAIAVGTQFNVYREVAAVEISVVRGEVAVFIGQPSWLGSAGSVPAQVQRVPAGNRILVETSGLLSQPVSADLNQTLAWLQHKIVFKGRPLREVAAEFNRYGSIPVEIDDVELGLLPVSGMFEAGDTESFVAFLDSLPGVKVERTPKRVRVVKIVPAT